MLKEQTWDSHDTKIDIEGVGCFTVISLRSIFESSNADEGDSASLWEDGSEDNIFDGIRRRALESISLRDQPILDKQQDEIFRLPIDIQCFLSGPPGTGKTTTLIRRLGQKTDLEALKEYDEKIDLVKQIENETKRPHQSSWIFFSPTELLRQYVKEAFVKENLPASNEHIQTWENYRRDLAREALGILRSGSGSGMFILRDTHAYLKPDIKNHNLWYDVFREYLDKENTEELLLDCKWLASNHESDISTIGEQLLEIIRSSKHDFSSSVISNIGKLIPDIKEIVSKHNDSITEILTLTRNKLSHFDRSFPDKLREQILHQSSLIDDNEEDNDSDIEFENEDGEILNQPIGLKVSRKQAGKLYDRAVKSLAIAQASRRQVSIKSQNGMLINWLGEKRLPNDDDIKILGKLLTEQGRLRKFERIERMFLRSILVKYKRFRKEQSKEKENRWYLSFPKKSADIFWSELDLLILATLQIGNEILNNYRKQSIAELPTSGTLGAIVVLQRAQVVVDEVSDFSCIQLACMYQIAHPSLRSFFMCGDINQRLTLWGIKSIEDINWIDNNILLKTIDVPYRQSRQLISLTEQIRMIDGADATSNNPSDKIYMDGYKPVWENNLSDDDMIANWLADRIKEINLIVQNMTIAILVNEEHQIDPLTNRLSHYLEEINLVVEACFEGKIVGNEHAVRVFSIQHIKGLEFEAVFFVDLDKTINIYPEIYAKYLYVGASRAATYFGITFSKDIPKPLEPLALHFTTDWKP